VEDNIDNNNQPWGEGGWKEGDFVVHASEPTVNPNDQDGRKRKGKMLVLALAGLSSYLCRLCPMCQSVQTRGSYPPHHNIDCGNPALYGPLTLASHVVM